jgi:hypothetical protein
MKFEHEHPLEFFNLFLVYFKKQLLKTWPVLIVTFVLTPHLNAAATDNTGPTKKSTLLEYDKKVTKEESDFHTAPQIQYVETEQNNQDKKTFFPYTSSLSIEAGAAANFKELDKHSNYGYPGAIAFRYMLDSNNSDHHEYGFDLITGKDPIFYLDWGYKHIFDHTDYFRPFFKLGFSMRFDEGDHLETAFDLKSYSLVATLGLEKFLHDPGSMRLDLDMHLGTEDLLLLLCLGWSHAF